MCDLRLLGRVALCWSNNSVSLRAVFQICITLTTRKPAVELIRYVRCYGLLQHPRLHWCTPLLRTDFLLCILSPQHRFPPPLTRPFRIQTRDHTASCPHARHNIVTLDMSLVLYPTLHSSSHAYYTRSRCPTSSRIPS